MRLPFLSACLVGWVLACSDGGSTQGPRTCADGETVCGDTCVEALTDPLNCGACGNACTGGQVCSQGTCSLTCSAGTTACGGSCVDPSVDPSNCGACGKACAPGEICASGACAAQCPPQQTLCVGDGGAVSCVTTTTDSANCGACGAACAPGKVCSSGTCSDTCGPGETLCPGGGDGGAPYCALTDTDQANCGMCGNACTGGKKCVSGTCQAQCVSGLSLCGTECINLQTDRDNCNACGTKCSGATPYCVAGKCVKQNILEDFENTTWIRSPWVAYGGSTTTTEVGACAHDGSYGLKADSGWIYRTDVSIGASGDVLSAWLQETGGRGYFGFASTSSGTYSLVLAANTNALIIQQNTGYAGYTDLATTAYTYTPGAWYRLGLAFGSAGLVTGTLYDATNVQVATVSFTISGLSPGGVAYRGFGSVDCIDTITN